MALGPSMCFISFVCVLPKFQCSNVFRGRKTLRTSILFTLVFSAWLGGNCHQHTLNPFWGENKMFLIWLNMRFAYLLAEGHALLGHDRMWSICRSFCFLSPQAEEEQSIQCCDATETI